MMLIVTNTLIASSFERTKCSWSLSMPGSYWILVFTSLLEPTFNTITEVLKIFVNSCPRHEWFTQILKIVVSWKSQSYILTSILTKWQRDSPMGVGISRKSMEGFEFLWTHNNFWNFFGPEGNFKNDLKIQLYFFKH